MRPKPYCDCCLEAFCSAGLDTACATECLGGGFEAMEAFVVVVVVIVVGGRSGIVVVSVSDLIFLCEAIAAAIATASAVDAMGCSGGVGSSLVVVVGMAVACVLVVVVGMGSGYWRRLYWLLLVFGKGSDGPDPTAF